MTTLREWVIRLWGTLRPSRREAELEEELRGHLETAAEHARRRADSTADSTEDARRAAAIRFGGMAQTMDALRDQRGLPWLDSVRRDLYYAWGAIARNPGFTLVSTATLGAGLTLSLTVVTVVNAYLIRPLPYPAADRLYSVGLATGGPGQPRGLADIDWTALDGVVEHRIAWDLDMYYLLGGSYPESAPGAWVTPGFLQALGLLSLVCSPISGTSISTPTFWGRFARRRTRISSRFATAWIQDLQPIASPRWCETPGRVCRKVGVPRWCHSRCATWRRCARC
jgi:hypothetical protein